MRVTQVALAALLLSISMLTQACDLVPMKIVQSIGEVGDVTVNFGEADDAQHPGAWQGPLQITAGSAPACSASDEVSIIEQPVMLGGGVLYVSTYSGSNKRIYALDVKTCKVVWRSDDFSAKAVFKKGKIAMGSRSVLLNKQCRPIAARGSKNASSAQPEK